jgi:hypothetical protein
LVAVALSATLPAAPSVDGGSDANSITVLNAVFGAFVRLRSRLFSDAWKKHFLGFISYYTNATHAKMTFKKTYKIRVFGIIDYYSR